jgi:prepilin peptidase dependent protein B
MPQLIATRRAQLGLNLIELMVGLVVGLVVLAAISTVYLNTARGSRDTMNANRLNQDLRAVMDIMVADIRRAGYWGTAVSGSTNPFTVRTSPATDIFVSAGCILYSYDATYNAASTAGATDAGVDFFGFQLNAGAVQTVTPGTAMNDTSVACNTLTWSNLTDPAVITIDTLTFSTASPGGGEPGSKCVNATTGATWTAAVSTQAACADATAAGYVAPGASDDLAETRQITILITAHHVSDTTLVRTLTESVLVRNNRIITP